MRGIKICRTWFELCNILLWGKAPSSWACIDAKDKCGIFSVWKKNYLNNKIEQLLGKTLTWLHKMQGIEKAAAE